MKITKPGVKAATTQPTVDTSTQQLNDLIFEDAVGKVNEAIDSLKAVVRRGADKDGVAKDSIANLSVILFDLLSYDNQV